MSAIERIGKSYLPIRELWLSSRSSRVFRRLASDVCGRFHYLYTVLPSKHGDLMQWCHQYLELTLLLVIQYRYPEPQLSLNERMTSSYLRPRQPDTIARGLKNSRQHGDGTIRYSPDKVYTQTPIKPLPPILPLNLPKRIHHSTPRRSPPRMCRCTYPRNFRRSREL